MMKKILLAFGAAILASAQPSVVSISPLQGAGTTATFTSVYRHPGGNNIQNGHYLGYLLILPTPNVVQFTATGSCLIEYNRISNGVRLIDNAGTGWFGGESGVPAGVGGTTLTNNYCSVNTSLVSVAFSGTDMTVIMPVTFNPALNGPLTTFTQGFDTIGRYTGMTQFGTWTAYPVTTPKPGPYIASIMHPAYSTLGPSYVEVTAGHTSGLAALNTLNILLADRIVGGTNRCHILYFHYLPPNTTHQINLVNDAGTGFAPYSNTTPPYTENSTCRIGQGINGQVMGAFVTSNQIKIRIPMLFRTDNVKTRLNIWSNVFDTSGNLTHWLAPGQ